MSDWIEKQLGDLMLVRNAKSKQLKSSEFLRTGSYPIVDQSERFICGYTDDTSKVVSSELPVIIFGDHTRHVKFVDFAFAPGADGTQIINPPANINSRFFFYKVQQASWLIGNFGYDRHFKHLKEVKITLPADPAEQARIAHILSTVDEAIEQTEALIAKYNRIRTGLMQDLLSARLTEWVQQPLGQLADVASGITLGKKHSGPDTVERPYLRVANVQDGYLNLTDITYIQLPKSQVERYELHNGDVLMNEGGDFDKLGRGTVWRSEVAGCLHQNHVFRVRCQQDRLLPDFLALISASPYGKRFFVLNSKQSTNLASINSTQLKSFPIPLPDIEEQRRLVGIFAQKTSALQMHQQQLAKLQTLKKGLMQDLLTGPMG